MSAAAPSPARARSTVLGHPVVCDVLPADEASRCGRSLADLLTAHPDAIVLAGWPAVILGSKQRYIGLGSATLRVSPKCGWPGETPKNAG